MKGLNLPKRARKAATKNHVDERGRKLPGYYKALRWLEHATVEQNQKDLPEFGGEPMPRKRRARVRGKDYPKRVAGTARNASNSGFAPVRLSRPGQLSGLGGKFDTIDVKEQEAARREAQSERDFEACVRSKVRKGVMVRRSVSQRRAA